LWPVPHGVGLPDDITLHFVIINDPISCDLLSSLRDGRASSGEYGANMRLKSLSDGGSGEERRQQTRVWSSTECESSQKRYSVNQRMQKFAHMENIPKRKEDKRIVSAPCCITKLWRLPAGPRTARWSHVTWRRGTSIIDASHQVPARIRDL
jgi:hypothetical protein